MTDYEQERPLASEAHRIAVNEDNNRSSTTKEATKKRNRNRCIKCCCCTTAVFGTTGFIILILMLTVFKVKDPKINLDYITIKGLGGVNPFTFIPTTNLTIIADMSIKNPNSASFKFRNGTTGIYYENVLIAEAQTPKGTAKANKTFKMRITIDVMLQKFLMVPRFLGDLTAGEMPVNTRSSIRGKAEVIGITIKKAIGVKLNCTVTVILASESIKDMECKRSLAM